MAFLNPNALSQIASGSAHASPFTHWVIDDFFLPKVAEDLENEFLDFQDSRWHCYDNAIELKKTCNNWNLFPSLTYRVFQALEAPSFLDIVEKAIGTALFADSGLHGGGWHIHGDGGNLNPHMDYSIHPKMKKQRKLNLIVYLSSQLREAHGGHLGLWTAERGKCGQLVKEVAPIFNRAVLFDTTQQSWHGMSRPLETPADIYRQSIAVYYLCEPAADASPRERALFSPRENQKGDKAVEELIRKRATVKGSAEVYVAKK